MQRAEGVRRERADRFAVLLASDPWHRRPMLEAKSTPARASGRAFLLPTSTKRSARAQSNPVVNVWTKGVPSLAILIVMLGCGGTSPVATNRYADSCTTFCENRYDCFGDPEGRRVNCPSACEGAVPIPGACEDAAVAWASCLAALTCEELGEVDAPERYCGTQHAAYEAACTTAADGGAGS